MSAHHASPASARDVAPTDANSPPQRPATAPPGADATELPAAPQLAATIRALRERRTVTDADFDAIFPPPIRARSALYWTPVDVARRAAELLVTSRATRVLDVGSGAGKFCLVGALTSPGLFTGIEQRAPLAELAQALAHKYRAARAQYFSGDMRSLDWRQFDAFYFFNPFAENCFRADQLDDAVELSPARFERDVGFALDALAQAPNGTRVATYHGLGADLPPSYLRVACEILGTDVLELWVQARG